MRRSRASSTSSSSLATDNIMVPRHISQRAPATCSLGCGATCSCPCIHIFCPENNDPAGCCVTFLKLHVLEICLHIEHRHVSTLTKQKKQQHNNYILTMCCNDMVRRSSTGDACLQAGPRRLRRKAHQKQKQNSLCRVSYGGSSGVAPGGPNTPLM